MSRLDTSLDGTSGPFVLKRSLSFTFSNPVYLGPGQTTKTFDDAVLNNGTSYAYEAFRRTLTDTLYFYHADHLGTSIAMTNGAGTLVWRAEHTPFGGIYALTVGAITNNLRFPGQYYDGETGLAQNYFRDYKHNTGRYWEPDPAGFTSNTNLYPYVGLDPTNLADFKGLQGNSMDCAKQTVFVCCAKAKVGGNVRGRKHCYIQVGRLHYELQPHPEAMFSQGYPEKNPAPIDPNADCAGTTGCNMKKCLDDAFSKYPSGASYYFLGPNSNTFAAAMVHACNLNVPSSANDTEAPGWGTAPPSQ